MLKSGIDQQAIISEFAKASADSGNKLRDMVRDATLKAMRSREVTTTNMRQVLKSITSAVNTGAAKNVMPDVDPEALIEKAVAGIDAAMLQTVNAQRNALQQFVDQGVAVQDKSMKQALAAIEKMEDMLFETIRKTTQVSGNPLEKMWQQVLSKTEAKGTATGSQASSAVEQIMKQSQENMRAGRQAAVDAATTMLKSYGTLVSGVLIGLSEGLSPAGSRSSSKKKAD